MKGRPVKRQKTTIKTLEKRRQMRHRPDPGRWFYSFIPFKVATGGAAPLIPLLTMNVGGGPADVGIVNAVGSTFSMVGGLFWGKLSDRLNRRKAFLLAGFLGTAIMTMVFALARNFPKNLYFFF
jgi:MFS family permease